MVCDDSKFADIIIHHFCRNDGNDSNDGMVIGAAWLKQLYSTQPMLNLWWLLADQEEFIVM